MPHEGVCHAGRVAKRPYGFKKMAHRPEQVEQSVMDPRGSRYHEGIAMYDDLSEPDVIEHG